MLDDFEEEKLPSWNRYDRVVNDDSDQLFEREIYPKMAAEIKQSSHSRMVVTGTPGVGQTWFVDYLARFLLKEGTAVILENDRSFVGDILRGEQRHLEILIPAKDGRDGTSEIISFKEKKEFFTDAATKSKYLSALNLIGDRKCWHLVDYRKKRFKAHQDDRSYVGAGKADNFCIS